MKTAMTTACGKCGHTRYVGRHNQCHKCDRERKKRLYKKNPDLIITKNRNYRLRNPDKVRVAKIAWWKSNPDKRAYFNHRRRARVAGGGGSHTTREWQALLDATGRRCLRCGIEELFEPLTRDHVVPLSRGGTNDIGNIQPLCRTCNTSKGTRAVDYRPVHVNTVPHGGRTAG